MEGPIQVGQEVAIFLGYSASVLSVQEPDSFVGMWGYVTLEELLVTELELRALDAALGYDREWVGAAVSAPVC